MSKTKVAIFASGTGSNAQKIYQYSLTSTEFEVACIVTNNRKAKVLEFAQRQGIPYVILDKEEFYQTKEVISILDFHHAQLIVLAGFLWLIPDYLIEQYEGRIINIHPALLPKYGGKGMYGKYIHRSVRKAGEKESGITIHYVNNEYDEGEIILQSRVKVYEDDTTADLSKRVLTLEHHFLPRIVEALSRKVQ